MRWMAFMCAAAALASAGCSSNDLGIDTDPNVVVEVTFKTPSVHVDQQALGTAITGGFTLSLHLGERASGPSEVNIEHFELISEDENTIIVESLPLKAQGGELPIVVEPDTDEQVVIDIDYGSKLEAEMVGTNLCAFGKVRYRGTITDSLHGGSTPVLTDPLQVTGCL